MPFFMEFSTVTGIAHAIVGLVLSIYDTGDVTAIFRSPFLMILGMSSGALLGFQVRRKFAPRVAGSTM